MYTDNKDNHSYPSNLPAFVFACKIQPAAVDIHTLSNILLLTLTHTGPPLVAYMRLT